MADRTSIEWTQGKDGRPGATWNPTTGCDRISAGCDNCYALTLAKRLKAMGNPKYQADGDPRTSGPGFGLTLHPDALDIPRRWRAGRMIFIDSMSDLLHARVPLSFVRDVLAVVRETPQHTYQLLTKRGHRLGRIAEKLDWPPNLWLGVSVEDQRQADERIPPLLDTGARVRWISAEPLLGPVDLHAGDSRTFGPRPLPAVAYGTNGSRALAGDGSSIGDLYAAMYGPNLDWVVIGGESGHGARPMQVEWVRSLVGQCQEAGVPVFVKQLGSVLGGRHHHDIETFPSELRVREYPADRTAVTR